jgi:signal transduction histidine kinase
LRTYGLAAALETIQLPVGEVLSIRATGVGRYTPELESAIYYCCLEAIQNATKHGGPEVRIVVDLRQHDDELAFQVTDDGPGFDTSRRSEGTGLENMRDRLAALDGRLSIRSAPGKGTTVAGSVPLHVGEIQRAIE